MKNLQKPWDSSISAGNLEKHNRHDIYGNLRWEISWKSMESWEKSDIRIWLPSWMEPKGPLITAARSRLWRCGHGQLIPWCVEKTMKTIGNLNWGGFMKHEFFVGATACFESRSFFFMTDYSSSKGPCHQNSDVLLDVNCKKSSNLCGEMIM